MGDEGALSERWRRFRRYDRRAEVVAVDTLTPTGTVRLVLRVADDLCFEFVPGQFVGLAAEMDDGSLVTRPYCVMRMPERNTFELLLRVVPEGPMSGYLAGRRPGEVLAFRGPHGRPMVPEEPGGTLVFVATGVGVGPCLGLVRHLLERGDLRPVRLYWGLRLRDDACLTGELAALERDHPDFRHAISLSQPPPDWTGLEGRVTASVPPLLDRLGDKHFVLCGNGAMIAELHAALLDSGVDKQRVHREYFFNARHRADPAEVAAIRRRLAARDLSSPLELWRLLGIDPETLEIHRS